MLASVIVAATAAGERYQQAARDRDTDNTRQQQREHDPSESSSHVRSSLRCSTRARPGVFVKQTVQRSVPGWVGRESDPPIGLLSIAATGPVAACRHLLRYGATR